MSVNCLPADSSAPAADPLATLNPEQREAVLHGTGDQAGDARALLVIAGAGSGKTNTLAHRVAHLIAQGADPQRLMLLTFSRRAAQEMERRAGAVLQRTLALGALDRPPALPWSGTFHSVGARLLRQYAAHLGLDEAFTVHDRGDSTDLMGMVRHDIGLSGTRNRFPQKGTCLAIYSRVLNTCEPLERVLQEAFPWCADWQDELKRLFGAYVEAKQQQNVLDYDDLLLFWSEMMAEPTLAAQVGGRFDHVLVDEYQDTNRLQAAIVHAMKPGGRGLTVVGDDAQSIYAFRGATVRNILGFAQACDPPARVVTLARNYRSTQPILDASNAVMAQAGHRHAKDLWTEREGGRRPQLVLVPDEAGEAAWVADAVLRQREEGVALKSQAVLFRTGSHSAGLELELARRNIPFIKFGGLKFLEASHVKDVLAVLRFAQNPRGRLAGFRAVQLVPGIGPAHASRLLDAMAEAAEPLAALQAFQAPPAAREDWVAFARLYAQLREPTLAWPADLELVGGWYQPCLERLHEDASTRRLDLEALARLAPSFGSRERFLTELTLDPPEATSAESGPPLRDEDYLILSTIHSAKGQEWSVVYVLHAVDGCIPSDMATGSQDEIDEERRLLYVAMTRAKQQLHLLVPHRFYVTQQTGHGDRHLYAGRSRFITEAVMARLDSIAWPAAGDGAAPGPWPAAPAAPVLQVRERARAAWR